MLTLPINVTGELQAACGTEALDVSAQGQRIVLKIPSLRASRLSAGSLGVRKHRERALYRLNDMARIAGLVVDVHLADHHIADFGAEVTQSRLEQLLARTTGLGPVRLRPLPLLRATVTLLLRRSPPASPP